MRGAAMRELMVPKFKDESRSLRGEYSYVRGKLADVKLKDRRRWGGYLDKLREDIKSLTKADCLLIKLPEVPVERQAIILRMNSRLTQWKFKKKIPVETSCGVTEDSHLAIFIRVPNLGDAYQKKP